MYKEIYQYIQVINFLLYTRFLIIYIGTLLQIANNTYALNNNHKKKKSINKNCFSLSLNMLFTFTTLFLFLYLE